MNKKIDKKLNEQTTKQPLFDDKYVFDQMKRLKKMQEDIQRYALIKYEKTDDKINFGLANLENKKTYEITVTGKKNL